MTHLMIVCLQNLVVQGTSFGRGESVLCTINHLLSDRCFSDTHPERRLWRQQP